MMTKYKLQKYSGISSRFTCPSCKRKHCFTRYIDEEGVPLDEKVGRCDHESSCGYHYTPKQYFMDHPSTIVSDKSRKSQPNTGISPESQPVAVIRPKRKVWWIPMRYVDRSVSFHRHSDFTTFLLNILDPLIVEGLIDEYKLGVTKSGDVIFFQLDSQGQCRTRKIMKYDAVTGHRIKDPDIPGRISWVHSILKSRGKLPKEWELTQCLFGEHLLSRFPDKTVALVESEKTAVICAGLLPEYIWLATGGKSQFGDKLNVLKGRNVIAFPDVDGYDLWRQKASERPELTITVSDLLERVATAEDRHNHIDVADLLIREAGNNRQRLSFNQIIKALPEEARFLIEELGLEVVSVEMTA